MPKREKQFKTGYQDYSRFQTPIVSASKTQQQFKNQCDINNIMKKYQEQGIVTHKNLYQGNYGDFDGSLDYNTMLQKVRESNEMFMSLPSSVRQEFNNDPHTFIEFVTNPSNNERMYELGLKDRPVPPSPPPRQNPASPKSTGSDSGVPLRESDALRGSNDD